MTTIVMNTLTGAVSEYDWAFQSITATHAGDAAGLYLLGGDLDGALPIDATIMSGRLLWSTSLKKRIENVWFTVRGAGQGLLRVTGKSAAWTYLFPVLATGASRAKPGQGIRENYLAVGYSNVDGSDFVLDQIEVNTAQSDNRRL